MSPEHVTLEVAKKFLEDEDGIDLSEATLIDNDAAEALAKHEGELALDGLVEISERTAEAFAKHQGDSLWLSGLTEISEGVAEALAKHEGGELALDSLDVISNRIADALAKHQGNLILGGSQISDEAVASLAQKPGTIMYSEPSEWAQTFRSNTDACEKENSTLESALNDEDPDQEFIVEVDFYYCDVHYSGFQILTRSEIQSLQESLGSDQEIGTPNMPGSWHEEFHISELEGSFTIYSRDQDDVDKMRDLFGDHVGNTDLFDSVLGNTTSFDDEAEQDEAPPKILTLEVAEQFMSDCENVPLDDYTSIEDDAAKVLARHDGDLELFAIQDLSLASAEALGEHTGILELGCLQDISTDIASALSKHKGYLGLVGIHYIDEDIAAILSTSPSDIGLLGLTSIWPEVAQALIKHEGDIRLSSGKYDWETPIQLTEEAIEILQRKSGTISEMPPSEWVEELRQNMDT